MAEIPRQYFFEVADQKFINKRRSILEWPWSETMVYGSTLWPKELQIPPSLSHNEDIHGHIFRVGGNLEGLPLNDEYLFWRDRVARDFENFLTPDKLTDFLNKTDHYEVLTFDGEDIPEIKSEYDVVMRSHFGLDSAVAAYSIGNWGLIESRPGVLIYLNLAFIRAYKETIFDYFKRIPELNSPISDQNPQELVHQYIRESIVHELEHALLDVVKVPHPKHNEALIEELSKKIVRGEQPLYQESINLLANHLGGGLA